MSRVFGWSLTAFFLFSLFANELIAIFYLVGSFSLGFLHGFDVVIIVMCSLFGFLVVGNLFSHFALIAILGKILNSLWPNLLIVLVKLMYLLLASLLFYGLFSSDNYLGLAPYIFYLLVAVAMTITNGPGLIFHFLICIPRYRRWVQGLSNKSNEIEVTEN